MDLLGYDMWKCSVPRNFDEEKEEAREYLGELENEVEVCNEMECPVDQKTLDEMDRIKRLLGY